MEGLGFEAAKGAAEKVLGVKLPILMRMVLPGLLATAVLYPAVAWALGHLPVDPGYAWIRLVAYGAGVFVLGGLISTVSSEVYKVYEGRIGWPDGLSRWARARQQARVDRLMARADAASADERYNEIWYQLRVYPTDDSGKPIATHPTRIGNILAGYEQYPGTRYSMDSVFYWPRIWLQMDKDQRAEIDAQWSVADGFLTLSVISFAGGAAWAMQALASLVGIGSQGLPFASAAISALAGAGWVVLGYGWYRLSLPFHRENGEVFKSIFDIYRNKVWDLTCLKPQERETWMATWAYLQYQSLRCPNCGNLTDMAPDQCTVCGFGLLELKRNLSGTGRFPV